jgi:TPR repeat protein
MATNLSPSRSGGDVAKLFVFNFMLILQGLYGWSQAKPPDADDLRLTPERFATLRQRATEGEARAQLILGDMYLLGVMVPQDYSVAARWYAAAAAQNDVKAQLGLGYLYEHGKGVRKDYGQAFRYYREAAQGGCDSTKQLSPYVLAGARNASQYAGGGSLVLSFITSR